MAVKYELLQIIPAQPDTWALFSEEDSGRCTRSPVVAWGMWRETHDRESFVSGGPLVMSDQGLGPAEQAANYAGVRIGRCIEWKDGETRYDHSEDLYDPAVLRR